MEVSGLHHKANLTSSCMAHAHLAEGCDNRLEVLISIHFSSYVGPSTRSTYTTEGRGGDAASCTTSHCGAFRSDHVDSGVRYAIEAGIDAWTPTRGLGSGTLMTYLHQSAGLWLQPPTAHPQGPPEMKTTYRYRYWGNKGDIFVSGQSRQELLRLFGTVGCMASAYCGSRPCRTATAHDILVAVGPREI
jgi:hypothetical protein